jgi:alpha 1,2-mannosyltransferase
MPWHSYPTTEVKPTTGATVSLTFYIKVFRLLIHLWRAVWSNFEIADLDFWRGEKYTKFFDYLDKKGGFYYEVRFAQILLSYPIKFNLQRWGDAPVHSIGAALFARKDQIHFFNDIGYRHEPFQHCPQGDAHKKGKCWCDPTANFGEDGIHSVFRGD